MTIKGGTKQACAACKYQRRKCAADCPLARYFPPDQPKMFLNAHRLFGLANIGRILKHVDSDKKDETMRSIIFESTIRARYPVHGCWGIVCKFQNHIKASLDELRVVKSMLASLKDQTCRQLPASPSEISTLSSHNALDQPVSIPLGQNDLYAETSEKMLNSLPLRQDELYAKTDENMTKTLKVENPFYDDYPITIPIQELEVPQYYGHDTPLAVNRISSFILSKQASESSAESKDATTSNKIKRHQFHS